MKVAVYYNNSDIRVEEAPVPEISSGELLLRVEASGICGSDVMEWYRVPRAPIVLGHEVAGTVEKVGPGVEKFRPGDRVTVAHHVPCNTCRYCLRGEHSVCDTLRTTNFDPGGFAEFLRVPAINVDRGVFLLPEGMTMEEGTFAEPLGCVARGLRRASFEAGKCVLVIGSGISGLLTIKLAAALGASAIVATDIKPSRLEAARRFGADHVLDARADVPAEVKKFLGRPADLVVLTVASDPALAQGIGSVDRGGTILFFAPARPGDTYPMPLFDLWRDNVTLVNTYASPPFDTMTALDLIGSGRVTVSDMITHRLPLSEAARGFRLVAGQEGDSIKVILMPHASV